MSAYYDMSSNKHELWEQDPYDDLSAEQIALNDFFAAIKKKDEEEINKCLAELEKVDTANNGKNDSSWTKRIINGAWATNDTGKKWYKFAPKRRRQFKTTREIIDRLKDTIDDMEELLLRTRVMKIRWHLVNMKDSADTIIKMLKGKITTGIDISEFKKIALEIATGKKGGGYE